MSLFGLDARDTAMLCSSADEMLFFYPDKTMFSSPGQDVVRKALINV